MQAKLVRADLPGLKTEVLVLFEAEGQRRPELDQPLSAFYEAGEIKGKLLEFTLIHGVAGYAATRLLLAGTGKPDKRDPATLRKVAAGAIRFLKGKGLAEVSVALDGEFATATNVAAVTEGAL